MSFKDSHYPLYTRIGKFTDYIIEKLENIKEYQSDKEIVKRAKVISQVFEEQGYQTENEHDGLYILFLECNNNYVVLHDLAPLVNIYCTYIIGPPTSASQTTFCLRCSKPIPV